MTSQRTGQCLLCGKVTKSRCSACATAGIDHFFCSPEHQKLVWPIHRFFCGPGKANPWRWPALSADEARWAIDNVDKPPGLFAEDRTCRAMSISEQLHHSAKMAPGSEPDYFRQAADPVFGAPDSPVNFAFAVRVAEFVLKRSYYPDHVGLMCDVSALTYFHQMASVSDVFDATEPWKAEFLHRLSVLALLAHSVFPVSDKTHTQSTQVLWQQATVALLTYVRMRIIPTEPIRGPKLVAFVENLYATGSTTISAKLAM